MITFLSPSLVMTRIVCNDGTISPGCNDCHKGCCSHHGGCSNSSTSSDSKDNSSSNNYTDSTPYENPLSSDNTLKEVTVNGVNISISSNMFYTTNSERVVIKATPNDYKAILTYNTNPELIIGINSLNIKVTAENGNIKNYNLNITREKILSDNKNIIIKVNGKEVVFNNYESEIIYLSYDISKLNIEYELEDNNAKAEILGNDNIAVGKNEVIVEVTAENGEKQDYIINVIKNDDPLNTEEKIDEEAGNLTPENNLGPASILIGIPFLGSLGYLIYAALKKS